MQKAFWWWLELDSLGIQSRPSSENWLLSFFCQVGLCSCTAVPNLNDLKKTLSVFDGKPPKNSLILLARIPGASLLETWISLCILRDSKFWLCRSFFFPVEKSCTAFWGNIWKPISTGKWGLKLCFFLFQVGVVYVPVILNYSISHHLSHDSMKK